MVRTSAPRAKIGLGIDIESVGRFRTGRPTSPRFRMKVFTRLERDYCLSKADPAVHYAGTFAAKEAAVKAFRSLRMGMGIVTIRDFQVYHEDNGLPQVKFLKTNGGFVAVDMKLSISHTAESAVAVVIATTP